MWNPRRRVFAGALEFIALRYPRNNDSTKRGFCSIERGTSYYLFLDFFEERTFGKFQVVSHTFFSFFRRTPKRALRLHRYSHVLAEKQRDVKGESSAAPLVPHIYIYISLCGADRFEVEAPVVATLNEYGIAAPLSVF